MVINHNNHNYIVGDKITVTNINTKVETNATNILMEVTGIGPSKAKKLVDSGIKPTLYGFDNFFRINANEYYVNSPQVFENDKGPIGGPNHRPSIEFKLLNGLIKKNLINFVE